VRRRPVALAVVLAALAAQPAAADPVDDYVRAQMKARRIPGLSIAVVQNGRVIKAEGYGAASLELDAAATRDTVYEIGSISKQIAADAILLLVEARKVSLDDPIGRYIDDVPAAWTPITVRHILSHTSGLADFDTGEIGFSYRREYTAREFVELLGRQPLQFTPGERWRYLLKDGTYRRGEPSRPMVIAPNGGVMMSVVDFAAWDIAITTGRLLHATSMAAMTEPVRLADGRTMSHGLGWFIDTFDGHEFGAHWGTTVAGYSAVIRRYVNDGITVIALANVDEGGGFAIDAIARGVANVYVPGVVIQG
jgi:CubicO group peptidase (beta-lactamase class C family)